MRLLVLLSTLLAGANVYAVSVANCPLKLTVSYADVYIEKTLHYVYEKADIEHDDNKTAASLTKAFNNLGLSKTELTLPLREARDGKCQYSTKGNFYKTRFQIYSSKGKDILMVDSSTQGDRGELARVYGTITKFGPKEIEVSKNAGLSLAIPRTPYTDFSAGGELVFIGKVRDFTAHVE